MAAPHLPTLTASRRLLPRPAGHRGRRSRASCASAGANIVQLGTSTRPTPRAARFFMRMEFDVADGATDRDWRRFGVEVAERVRDALADVGRRAAASGSRSCCLALGPLPARSAVALAPRRARRPRSCSIASNHEDLRGATSRRSACRSTTSRSTQRRQAGGRGAAARAARAADVRPRRARPLHADPLAATSSTGVGVPVHQHPPLVPARLRRRGTVRAREGARREADRRDRATT